MSTTYFTEDTHFGHKSIIKYTKRPFSSANHPYKILIANWNSVVRPDDEVKTMLARATVWQGRFGRVQRCDENRVDKDVVGPM